MEKTGKLIGKIGVTVSNFRLLFLPLISSMHAIAILLIESLQNYHCSFSVSKNYHSRAIITSHDNLYLNLILLNNCMITLCTYHISY